MIKLGKADVQAWVEQNAPSIQVRDYQIEAWGRLWNTRGNGRYIKKYGRKVELRSKAL